jgi:hypothetical protein
MEVSYQVGEKSGRVEEGLGAVAVEQPLTLREHR